MCIRALFLVALGIFLTLGVLALTYKVKIGTLQDILIIAAFCQFIFAWPLGKSISRMMTCGDIQKIKKFILALCNAEYDSQLEVPNEREEEDDLVRIKRDLNTLARVLANYKQKSAELYQQERQKTDQYKNIANIDPLTQIPNRRGFKNEMERRMCALLQQGKPFYLLLIDLDDFKQVNDRYGHLEGDEILRFLGETLRSNTRENDFPFRFGGDEFGLFLDDCAPELAQNIARRIQNEFAKHALKTGVSIGGHRITPDLNAKDLDNIIHLADAALYEAKKYKKGPDIQKNIVIN